MSATSFTADIDKAISFFLFYSNQIRPHECIVIYKQVEETAKEMATQLRIHDYLLDIFV